MTRRDEGVRKTLEQDLADPKLFRNAPIHRPVLTISRITRSLRSITRWSYSIDRTRRAR